jgi:hypothetical protein
LYDQKNREIIGSEIWHSKVYEQLSFLKTPKTDCHLTLAIVVWAFYYKYLIFAALFTKQIISQSKAFLKPSKQSNHVPV